MTDEWKDSLLRYCDVFDTKDGSYLNEHNVINFIEELLHQATSKAREEERRRMLRFYGDFHDDGGRTVRFYELPHTEHKPGDDGNKSLKKDK